MSLFADVAARPEFRRFNREREPRLGNYSSVRTPHIEFCRRMCFVEIQVCLTVILLETKLLFMITRASVSTHY